MKKMTRARFLGLSAAFAGGAVGFSGSREVQAQATSNQSGTEPDLVVINARVYTINNAHPRAEALAVKDGKFIAVGSTSDVKNLAGRQTHVIDADQMTVTPSEEAIKGSISVGKLADFVILEKDPHNVDPSEIKDIKVVRTVVGGKTMYPESST